MQLRTAVRCAKVISEESVLLRSCALALSAGTFVFNETSNSL